MTGASVLVIDDDAGVGLLIHEMGRANGIECVLTVDASTFLSELTDEIQLIFLDLLMPDEDGIEILRELGARRCKAAIVLMSGVGRRVMETAGALGQSLGLNMVGQLQKPFRMRELEALLTGQIMPTVVKVEAKVSVPAFDTTELVGALERDELVLHYQPQVDIESGNVVGVEGLVRWQHPKHGLIYPDAFIGRLEELRLIDELGWLVIRHAFSEMGAINEAYGRTMRVALNVSVYSLLDLTFPDRFVAMAKDHDVLPEDVILEITEGGLIHELSRTLDVLTRLRMKGVHLSIDDFGTGYSMIQQLRHIPATEMKIDRSIVQGIFTESHRVMVEKTIELGHELGMVVVAEGVEATTQLEFLRERMCDVAQGFLFSTPHPVERLVVWLKEYGR